MNRSSSSSWSAQRPARARATLAAVAVLSSCAAAPVTTPEGRAPATVGAAASAATDEATLEQRFARWVASFRSSAQAAGIDEATLHDALDDVHYLPRVVELDRAQPEFARAVWDYLDSAVSPQRVAPGQDK